MVYARACAPGSQAENGNVGAPTVVDWVEKRTNALRTVEHPILAIPLDNSNDDRLGRYLCQGYSQPADEMTRQMVSPRIS